jgi:hypothetical protein
MIAQAWMILLGNSQQGGLEGFALQKPRLF